MRRSTWINLVLLLLVMLLGARFLAVDSDDTEESYPPLTRIAPESVTRIRIHNNNGPEFTMQREATGWVMTSPYRVAANGPRIEILLDLLSAPSYEHYPLPAKGRLAEFGLDRPLAEVQFNETLLRFGGTHPTNYRRYVAIGDQLHLTADRLTFSDFPRHFLARAEDFVSHALFPEETQITTITTEEWSLRRIDGQWRLTPEREGVSAAALETKAGDWQSTWVAKVEKAPEESSDTRVTIEIAQRPAAVVIEVLRRKDDLLLIRRDLGLAYRLPASSNLLSPPE